MTEKLDPDVVRYSARAKFQAARKDGLIGPATDHNCMDCGEPATQWDHRDYFKPLDVDPVCQPCNMKRGQGFPPSNKVRFQATDKKSRHFDMRLTPQEMLALEALAKRAGMSKSNYLRGHIRCEATKKRIPV